MTKALQGILVMALAGFVGLTLLAEGRKGSNGQNGENQRVDVNDMRGGGFRVPASTGEGKDRQKAAQEAAVKAEQARLKRIGIVDRATALSGMDRATTPTNFFTESPSYGW